MGFDFISQVDPDFATTEQYFQDYANQRRIWLASKGGFDAVEDEEGVVQLVEREAVAKGRGYRVLAPYARVELSDLGRSPKALAQALEAMGWTVSVWRQEGEHEEVLFVSDSKEGDANQHRSGDVRYPTKTVRRYCVEGRFGEHPVGIQAFYEGEDLLDAKGKLATSGSFQNCRIRDSAYGIVQLDTVDYTRSKQDAEERRWSEERRIQEGMAMNRRYPAEAHKVHSTHYSEADPMNQWVDFYLDLTKTENGGRRLTRKKKAPEPKPKDDLERMNGAEEWSG